jgi:hypothetical protein
MDLPSIKSTTSSVQSLATNLPAPPSTGPSNMTKSALMNVPHPSSTRPLPTTNYPSNNGPKPQKYSKICPAIAPKPMMNIGPKLPFNASIPKGKSALNMTPSLSDSLVGSLNTSKTWVLPPRPRPGRKPNANDNQDLSSALCDTKKINVKTLPKKRIKVSPAKDQETTANEVASNDTILKISDPKPQTPISGAILPPQSTSSRHIPPTVNRSEMSQLKETYLSKLKEQELIRSYIEVMTNQIKELSFVQNGVITFDALRNNPSGSLRIKKTLANNTSSTTTSITTTPSINSSPSILPIVTTSSIKPTPKSDQLESINNINDLNNFLNYLTKSSKIIHSVTKKNKFGQVNSNQQPLEPEYLDDQDIWLNNQINYYLEVRAKFKAKNDKTLDGTLNIPPSKTLATKTLTSKPTAIPELLRPLPRSFFDDDCLDIVDDGSPMEDTTNVNDANMLILEDREFDNLIMDTNIEPSSDNLDLIDDESDLLGAVKIHDPRKLESETSSVSTTGGNIIRKKSKLNCGFCTNDTPCLCLDAEIEICNVTK